LAHQTQDDGFREIQLNGKQLVFLFMAATVVSVVIFLCGVLVGRGVRAERTASMADATGDSTPTPDTPSPALAPPPPAVGANPTTADPPPAVDDLSYFKRLEKPNPPAEELKTPPVEPLGKPTVQKSAAAAVPGEARAPAVAEPAAKQSAAQAAAEPSPGEPAGSGYAVQIAALNVRSEAEAIAKRLSSKGYTAYVVAPARGTSMYRVRVGKFDTRREAETVAAKLQKEEQFHPWITR
jgi:cell division septation protein DedD